MNLDDAYVPKGAVIWVGPVNCAPPIFVEGEPYSVDENGVTKWQQIGTTDGNG